MPHRSAVYHPHHYPGAHPHHPAPATTRPPRATLGLARLASDFTFTHAGHQLRVGPIAFWIVVGTLVIMAAWSITTATYFAFREDVLTRLVSREAEMQFGYEDRIAELRAQIDRLSSRQLLDQEQYDRKLDQILHRQATLESRASALGSVADPTPTGSIKPSGGANAKPAPVGYGAPRLAPGREGRLDGAPSTARLAAQSGDIDSMLARVQASLDRVEARQRATLNTLAANYDSKVQRMRGVLADLGIDASKLPPAKSGMGGPFVPLILPTDTGGFDRALTRVNVARAQVESLTRTLVGVPVRKPIPGDDEIVSGFGVRVDPFNNRPAMHTGLDFRGEVGESIHATANGTVTVAGWSGGYGKMVEVNHGNGFATRYGHMSEIDVQVGQQVRIGQVLGKVGTTGRSTGPHLHYETRVDGEAVDPQKFLHAGAKLTELQ